MDRRVCYECRHFYMSVGDVAYSEITPGYSWSMDCCKNVWEFDPYEDDQDAFRKALNTANTCEHFEEG